MGGARLEWRMYNFSGKRALVTGAGKGKAQLVQDEL